MAKIHVFFRHKLVAVALFFSFSIYVFPPPEVELPLIIPEDGGFVVDVKADAVFIFFDVEDGVVLVVDADSKLKEGFLGQFDELPLRPVWLGREAAQVDYLRFHFFSEGGSEFIDVPALHDPFFLAE